MLNTLDFRNAGTTSAATASNTTCGKVVTKTSTTMGLADTMDDRPAHETRFVRDDAATEDATATDSHS